tara:strand:+ start:2652 stop:2825 length:174 start_codon:yes stop_codon:yes gene_type:complete
MLIPIVGYYFEAEITIAPILGFMFGSLYSYSDFDNGREHTLQVCILFVSLTVQWIET